MCLKMADFPGTSSLSLSIPEQAAQEESSTLQTIELDPQSSTAGRSVLQFDGGSGELSSEDVDHRMDNSEIGISPIVGTELMSRPRTTSKGAALKEWSTFQLKVTKQVVSEKFGRGVRTVDPQLESRIANLKETQKKYAQLISLTTQFHINFSSVVETQKSLAEHFAFMSIRSPELHSEFHYNSEAQKRISRNGDTLLQAVHFFLSNIQTVCNKTMEDTLQTVKGYETARLTYDAYRSELENLKKQVNTSPSAQSKIPLATAEFEKHKATFEQLRHDVDIKLKLLDENKVPLSTCVFGYCVLC